MADSSPTDGSEGTSIANMKNNACEDSPPQFESRPRSVIVDADDLAALAAEFSEAEKAITLTDDDKLAPKGAICKVKEIFDTKTSGCSCCTIYVEEKPGLDRAKETEAAEIEAAENRLAQFSIIRRMTPHGAGRWNTHSIVVNSRRIQASLAKVFKGYPVTYADDHELVLKPKWIPFCHRWDRLLEEERNETDAETQSHLTLLRSILDSCLAESLKRRDLVARTGLATFDDLELLFEPGQTVILGDTEDNMDAGIVCGVDKCGDCYLLTVDTTAWDGEQFGLTEKEWRLDTFKGTRKVHGLHIFPLHMHPECEKISRGLIERGKKYERLRGQHFLAYASKTDLEHVSNPIAYRWRNYLAGATAI